MTAKFLPVEVGIRDGEVIEITRVSTDGAQVITTGASALKDGDRIVAANQSRAERPIGTGPSTGSGARHSNLRGAGR